MILDDFHNRGQVECNSFRMMHTQYRILEPLVVLHQVNLQSQLSSKLIVKVPPVIK